MLKKVVLIVLSVAVLVAGVTVYYFNSLPASEDLIKECEEDLKSSVFSGFLIGYANGKFSLPLQSVVRYDNGETIYADMHSDHLRLINGNKSMECEDADKLSSLVADGDDIYYFYENDEGVFNIYKTDSDFTKNIFICSVPAKNWDIIVENSVIYYVFEENGKNQIKRWADGKTEVIFESEEEMIPLFAENEIVYLKNDATEKLYSFDVQNKILNKLPLNFITARGNGYYEICGAEFVSEDVMKVFLSYHWGPEDFEGTNLIYLFNTETGRKLKVEL